MDLSDSPAEAEFRARVRAWLAETLPRLAWPEPADLVEKAPFWRDWQRRLYDAGYAGLTWSRDYGGQGLGEDLRAMVAQDDERGDSRREARHDAAA